MAKTFFATKGIPTDALSKFAWSTHKTYPENPTSVNTAPVQTLLNTMNTSIMSGSKSIGAANRPGGVRLQEPDRQLLTVTWRP